MKIRQLRGLRVAYPLQKISMVTGRATTVRDGTPDFLRAEILLAWANARRLRYSQTLTSPDRLCWSDDVGITEVDSPIPPLKVDAVFAYPRKKAPLTRKEFERARKDGKIVVSSDLRGEIRTRDQPFVRQATIISSSEHSVGNPRLQSYAGTRVAGPNTWSDSGVWDSQHLLWPMLHYRPNQTSSSGLKAHYVTLEGIPSTLLTEYRREVSDIQTAIRSQFESFRASTGLVTSGVAELNASIFDITTELAELPDTVRMIYDALRKGLMFYLECKNRDRAIRRRYKDKPPESVLDEIASIWLTFRYGIQPIAYSVSDALDYLDLSGVLYRTVRKREDPAFTLDLPHGASLLMTPSVEVRYFGKGRLSASTTQGLGFNPITTAWELVPLSFVVDWFLNVGDLLGALAPSASFDQSVHTESVRWKQELPILFKEQVLLTSVDLYTRKQIHSPVGRIGLTVDPFINMKRSLDSLALSWLGFKSFLRKS